METINGYEKSKLDAIAGSDVDLSPWAYRWRADRTEQEKPEAYFIPRRLERINTVYRTALPALGEKIKSYFYQNQLDILQPLLPAPSEPLLSALLWVGSIAKYKITLVWPDNARRIPSPDEIEVRTYPTAWGWFGWTADKILDLASVSDDGLVWTYLPNPEWKMDFCYNKRVAAATEMIAVFGKNGLPIPEIRVTGDGLGVWKSMDVTVEWFSGHDFVSGPDFITGVETHVAIAGKTEFGVKSFSLPLLYSSESRYGLDSKLTVRTAHSGATVLIRELEDAPKYIPEQGLYIKKADYPLDAAQYAENLRKNGAKNIRDFTRDHYEASSWEEIFRNVRLSHCPDGTAVPPFPRTASEPEMKITLPDSRWTDMYRTAVEQLRGPHMWGMLASEIGRTAYGMELIGLHDEADRVYDYFLASPGVKSEGDFTDPAGSLEWAKGMVHDIGYSHEGTHCSTGRLLFSMAQRYFLTGDSDWFLSRKDRLRRAADWIINERGAYMAHIPNRDRLQTAGLLPPSMLGDYALPSCDWRWYYADNAQALQGLQRFADALEQLGDADALYYKNEAKRFRADLADAVGREALYAPVRTGRDGVSRVFIPRMAYAGGLLHYREETNIPNYNYGITDLFCGALPLAEPFAAIDPCDKRILGTIDAMEEAGTYAPAVAEREAELIKKGLPADDAWFWFTFPDLPKCSENANIYLYQDDIPNFLRFFLNTALTMVGADGRFWEHAHLTSYDDCTAPDNGTSGWFVENLRLMLVTELDGVLWLAKGTPRSWLRQGKQIKVEDAPTLFGAVGFEINSETETGVISVLAELPGRIKPKSIYLRLRHPDSKPIKKVTVNGRDWTSFDAEREIVILDGFTGTVEARVYYG